MLYSLHTSLNIKLQKDGQQDGDNIVSEKHKDKKNHTEDPRVAGRIILEWRLKTQVRGCVLLSKWLSAELPSLNLRNSTKSGKQRQTSSQSRYRDSCYKAWSNRRPVYGPHFQITWPMLQRVRRLASYRPNVRLKARYSHPYVCSTEAMSVTSRVSRISATSRRRTKERPSPDSVNIQCTASCS